MEGSCLHSGTASSIGDIQNIHTQRVNKTFRPHINEITNMKIPWNWSCLAFLLVACQCKTHHTVWLPAGKLVSLPCKLRQPQKRESAEWWVRENQELDTNFTSNSIAAWYDRLGNLLHVGEILLIHVPPFEASELSVTQYAARPTPPTEKPMSLMPEYRSWIGGTHQILKVKHMDSVTCSELQTSTVIGYRDPWKVIERKSRIGRQVFFTFKIYVQPVIIWNYAVPPEIEFENRSVLLKPVTDWCYKQRSVKKRVARACSGVYEHRRPFVKLSGLKERMPLVQSTALGYTELGVQIELSVSPLSLLANPTNGELSYLHAHLKYSLDMYLLEDLENQLNLEDPLEWTIVATRLSVICPPGTFTFTTKPVLRGLNFQSLLNSSFKDSSAEALLPYKLICHPCPDGTASRAPYTYDDGCYKCPRGYYRGSTGWPSSAGCLRCPEGFTTDTVGATSIGECKLNAGAITRWILSQLLQMWFSLEQIIAGKSGPETPTRALPYDQQSAWAWLGRLDRSVWICGGVYCLVVMWLTGMAVYRLHLYFRLQSIFKKQYRLLLKAVLIGQINLVSHIKQRAKQSIKADPNDPFTTGALAEMTGAGE
ncbi:hypothetical protein CSKR_114217 [Clonorchis sinensis]|uniref:Tyrosine-protein kinase ephrin type A/B receptor-like domain-containing protein n=1 Tax=Clonorchis sinensis TaxID=79923 RepID=A0A3R7HAB9_CLOSI|nr:hypothetical protein CSKR_114217 [Clonorchis sinensis]